MNTSKHQFQKIKVKKWRHLLTHPEMGPFSYTSIHDLKLVMINEFRTKHAIAEDMVCVSSAPPWRCLQLWPDRLT